jgi:hypothetical protein
MERETSSEKVIDSKEIGNERIDRGKKRGKNRDSQFVARDHVDDFHDVDLSSTTRATSTKGACRGTPNFLSNGAGRRFVNLLSRGWSQERADNSATARAPVFIANV